MGIKITRKLLDDYRRLKREIPLLELELVEMLQGDNGFDNSTIFDYRTGEGNRLSGPVIKDCAVVETVLSLKHLDQLQLQERNLSL